MSLVGIIVAMPEEAEPIIDALKMEKRIEGYYSNDKAILILSGIGKCNAQNAAWSLFNLGCERIINIGSAGDLGNHEIGTLVLPNIFLDGDFSLEAFGNFSKDPSNVNKRFVEENRWPANKEEIYTFSTFVDDCKLEGSIVDMEAYGIASACAMVGIPFIAVKAISDHANGDATEDFKNNVESGKELSVVEKNMAQIIDIVNNYDKWYMKIYDMEEKDD